MSLHIFGAVNGWPELFPLVLPIWQEYAAQYGYVLHIEKDTPLAYPKRHHTFSKTKLVLDYYKANMPEALWVIDLDMIVTNFHVPAQNFPSAKHAITITKDVNGLNSGSYFLSGFWTQQVELWLNTVIAMRDYTQSEQHSMQLLQEAYDPYTFYWGHPSFNSMPLDEYSFYRGKFTHEEGNWAVGDFTCHWPGLNEGKRVELFHKYSPQIIR